MNKQDRCKCCGQKLPSGEESFRDLSPSKLTEKFRKAAEERGIKLNPPKASEE